MNPEQRIQQFATQILIRGASELGDPQELVGACVLVIVGSFRDGATAAEVEEAIAHISQAIRAATGHTRNTGGPEN